MRYDLVHYAGIRGPVKLDPLRAMSMRIRGADHAFVHGLDLATNLSRSIPRSHFSWRM